MRTNGENGDFCVKEKSENKIGQLKVCLINERVTHKSVTNSNDNVPTHGRLIREERVAGLFYFWS
jgi:hypothetical protein